MKLNSVYPTLACFRTGKHIPNIMVIVKLKPKDLSIDNKIQPQLTLIGKREYCHTINTTLLTFLVYTSLHTLFLGLTLSNARSSNYNIIIISDVPLPRAHHLLLPWHHSQGDNDDDDDDDDNDGITLKGATAGLAHMFTPKVKTTMILA